MTNNQLDSLNRVLQALNFVRGHAAIIAREYDIQLLEELVCEETLLREISIIGE